MACGQMAVFVLNQVQVLDQQITAQRAIAHKGAQIVHRLIVQLAALGRDTPLALARLPDALAIIQCHLPIP